MQISSTPALLPLTGNATSDTDETAGPVPSFHRCAARDGCACCDDDRCCGRPALDWPFVDGVYCISLAEREDRLASVTDELHRVGLCRSVVFHRPVRHPDDPIVGIWESHREVARHARALGHERILVLEDDVEFTRTLCPRRLASIAHAMTSLPAEWQIFYLGHWPIHAQRISRHLLRTRSACTHAYVASSSAIAWLADSSYQRASIDHRWSKIIGRGIDAAFATMLDCYAYFPMVAIQSTSPSDHLRSDQKGRIDRLRDLVTHTRAREVLLSRLMIPNQYLAVLRGMLAQVRDQLVRGLPETELRDDA